MKQFHSCGICGGIRENNGSSCLGCGTELDKCIDQRKKPKAPRCPKCQSGTGKEIEPGRYCCKNCQAVFEAMDFSFLDDRPDRNVEKKERLELDRKKRGVKR